MPEARKPDPRLAQAEALLGARNPAGAAALMSALLARPGTARADCRMALLLRSQAREAMREIAPAIEDIRAALAIEDRDARTHNSLGILLIDNGDMEAALGEFRRATEIDPNHARAWANIGNTLRTMGRFTEAVDATRRAVSIKPDYFLAWSNLGAMLVDIGNLSDAYEAHKRALALKPGATTLVALANIDRLRGDLDTAIAFCSRAAAMAPDEEAPIHQLGGLLAERDDIDAAMHAYRTARRIRPNSIRLAFAERLTLPMIYSSGAEVAEHRERYAASLARLEEEVPALAAGRSADDVMADLRWTNFLLAYEGEDDRRLQEQFAAISASAVDMAGKEWRAPMERHPPARSRIRIGFASALFSEGTVGFYFRSWVTGLDRSRFEVIVYNLRHDVTPYQKDLVGKVDNVRNFPGADLTPARIATAIRADALDILVYPELGMDKTAFVLAALRLAPIQCAGWGHPVTTGHRTIDRFITCAPMEPDDGDAHYTEKLLRLPGIGTNYATPAVPDPAPRARFGFDAATPLLLCPQSLFKIHPDNDTLFARVLRKVPAAKLVMFEGRHPKLTSRFIARLRGSFEREGIGFDGRVVFLPQCDHDDFLRINSMCDVMLDTQRWSGGNTSLDALAAGLPIVTRPGRFMRGRQSAAMLSLAGLDDLVAADADDYVRIAARVATDAPWREALRARIRDGRGGVFNDPQPVAALASALESLAGSGTTD
jgi:predicted O-linked N-acetylglucosamine transferase (SPINDLY family)